MREPVRNARPLPPPSHPWIEKLWLTLALTLMLVRWVGWFAAPFALIAVLTVSANLVDAGIRIAADFLLASREGPPQPY